MIETRKINYADKNASSKKCGANIKLDLELEVFKIKEKLMLLHN